MDITKEIKNLQSALEKIISSDKKDFTHVEDILQTLGSLPVTLEILKQTKVALIVNKMRKSFENKKIQEMAKELRNKWMDLWETKKEKLTSNAKNSVSRIREESPQEDAFDLALEEGNASSPSDKEARQNGESSRCDNEEDAGSAVAIFYKILCLVPRYRLDIFVYPKILEVFGTSCNYRISYSDIKQLFLLPESEGSEYHFVISLNKPICRGRTTHNYLVFRLDSRVEVSHTLSLKQEVLDRKYSGRLQRSVRGPEHKVIGKIISVLARKELIRQEKKHCISCSYKSNMGSLYPMDEGFAFFPKPPLFVDLKNVSSVRFNIDAGRGRSLDFEFQTNAGRVHRFNCIAKEEYGKLINFIQAKHIREKKHERGRD